MFDIAATHDLGAAPDSVTGSLSLPFGFYATVTVFATATWPDGKVTTNASWAIPVADCATPAPPPSTVADPPPTATPDDDDGGNGTGTATATDRQQEGLDDRRARLGRSGCSIRIGPGRESLGCGASSRVAWCQCGPREHGVIEGGVRTPRPAAMPAQSAR